MVADGVFSELTIVIVNSNADFYRLVPEHEYLVPNYSATTMLSTLGWILDTQTLLAVYLALLDPHERQRMIIRKKFSLGTFFETCPLVGYYSTFARVYWVLSGP